MAVSGVTLSRENDGSLIIMAGNESSEDTTRVGVINMRKRPKRGEAWKTSDPEQEAMAQFIIDAVNEKIAREGA